MITLLPYLTGLLEHGKIDAKDALALNRLANPVEYYFAGTKEFAEALRLRAGSDPKAIAELITQFQDDNPAESRVSADCAKRISLRSCRGSNEAESS